MLRGCGGTLTLSPLCTLMSQLGLVSARGGGGGDVLWETISANEGGASFGGTG